MLPMTGNFHGPRGNFGFPTFFEGLVNLRINLRKRKNRKMEVMKDVGDVNSSISLVTAAMKRLGGAIVVVELFSKMLIRLPPFIAILRHIFFCC